MRLIIIMSLILLVRSLPPGAAEEKILIPFDTMPSWTSDEDMVRIVDGDPSYLEILGRGEIGQQISIPGCDALVVDIRMPKGRTGRLFLKLIEESGSEYITQTLTLAGTGDWQRIKFKAEDLFVAPWSDDDNYYLDFPLKAVYFVFTPQGDASLQLKNFRSQGEDTRLPTAQYPLVAAWIERLASAPQPAMPAPPQTTSSSGLFLEKDSNISWRGPGYELRIARQTGELELLSLDGAEWKPEDGRWWSIVTFDGEIIDNTQADSFEYSWHAADIHLRITYKFSDELEVSLVISGTDDSLRFKTLIRNIDTAPIRCFRLPDGLPVATEHIRRMVLPRLGGVELLPGYFETHRRLGMDYPSDALSDFAWAEVGASEFAVYAVQDEDMFWSSRLKLSNIPDEGRSEYTRETNTFVGAGGSWVSPSIVFLSGHDTLGSYRRYWQENGLDDSPSLESKLGDSLFRQLSSSVLLKYDFDVLARDMVDKSVAFTTLAQRLSQLPAPILLHPVNFWEPPVVGGRPDGGVFDKNYPDFLPPREDFGGAQGFARYRGLAGWHNMPVMPYINPTCWDKGSASYIKHGDDVAVKNADGSISMGWGMASVTMSHPSVQEKNRENLEGFTGDHRVDILFEDQVGARKHIYDFSPHALHPAAYVHNLIEHAKAMSAEIPLMTERGFDMLVPYESGFCGIELGLSCTTFMKGWEWDSYYGKGNWRVFPLETYFFGPHAALHHHDLGQFVMNKSDLSWCLAKGYNMTYSATIGRDWLLIADAFQKAVSSLYFGQQLQSFEYLNDHVTRTIFPKVTIYANHNPESAFVQGVHTIAPEGSIALDPDGQLIAGVLTRMHGVDLGRECFVIHEMEPNRIRLRLIASPSGPAAFVRPKDWIDGSRISVMVVMEDGYEPVEFEVSQDAIKFEYALSHDGEPVKEYVALYGH